jgi:hypothetical protein
MSVKAAGLNDVNEFSWLVLGSIIIALSSGIGLVSSFAGRYLVVYISLLGFLLGYRICQIGVYNGKGASSIIFKEGKGVLKTGNIDRLGLLSGSLLISMGFVLLTGAIQTASLIQAANAAVIMGAGYMVTHWIVNNTLV